MKRFKKLIGIILALCLCLALGVSTLALGEGDARVVIGADLSSDQIQTVYNSFGITRGSVTELVVTNAEERSYLEGVASESVIGTRSISCVYIRILAEGSGMDISIYNINWCTKEMYEAALMTAGITDAEVKVGAPFSVSGTAALTGIYKAYEDLTGTTLSADAKQAAAEELVLTAELAEVIDEYDALSIVNELKLILDETVNMTDEEVRLEIINIANDYGYSLTDSEITKLISLCRSLEGLDTEQLKVEVENFQKTLNTLNKAAETGGKVAQWFKDTFSEVGNWFKNLFGKS